MLLDEAGLIETSKLVENKLYRHSTNAYYGAGLVEFDTEEQHRDFNTHAIDGKALAFLITHRIHEIFIKDYLYNNHLGQEFICHELSGGDGQLVFKILSLIKLLAQNDLTPNSTWKQLWYYIKIITYEISSPLSNAQNNLMCDFNLDRSPLNLRYESINRTALQFDLDKIVYLSFSNELFDALPFNVVYKKADDELYLQFCLPILPITYVTTANSAEQAEYTIRRDKFVELFAGAGFSNLHCVRTFEPLFNKFVENQNDYVIPKLSDLEFLPDVKFIPFNISFALARKHGFNLICEIITNYTNLSRLPTKTFSYYSHDLFDLIVRLANHNVLNNMHFDYYSRHIPAFTNLLDQHIRQYPSEQINGFAEDFGNSFAYTNANVDITTSPDQRMIQSVFRALNIASNSASQEAPFILNSQAFAPMLNLLAESGHADEILKDILTYIQNSNSFSFVETAKNISILKSYSDYVAPFDSIEYANNNILFKIDHATFSPLEPQSYSFANFLNQDYLGLALRNIIVTPDFMSIVEKYLANPKKYALKLFEVCYLNPALLALTFQSKTGQTFSPWREIICAEQITIDMFHELVSNIPVSFVDIFVRNAQDKLLMEDESVNIEKRTTLLDIVKYWQLCLHVCITHKLSISEQLILTRYTDLSFAPFRLNAEIPGNYVAEFRAMEIMNSADLAKLNLNLSPLEFKQNLLQSKNKYYM